MNKYYYYRTYNDGNEKSVYRMYVTSEGVYLDFKNGKMLDTGIVPSSIHPEKKKLSRTDIEDLHRFIKYHNYEIGKLYSKKEYTKIKKRYQKFRKTKQ